MDQAKPSRILLPALVLVLIMLTAAITPVASQAAATACITSSLISSFTPCFNFLTGSTNGGGGSPTAGCCQTLASLIGKGAECVCLVLTGNVPISLPINRTLAITLPKLCKSQSVPLHCTDTAAPLASAGAPIGYSPSFPALPPFKAVPAAPSLSPALAPPPPPPKLEPSSPSPVGQGIDQGQSRPLLFPSSAGKQSHMLAPSFLFSSLMLCTILLV